MDAAVVALKPGADVLRDLVDPDVGWLPGTDPVGGVTGLGGHVVWTGGRPGVFADLNLLTPGDTITVTTASGRAVDFLVTGGEEFSDSQVPSSVRGPRMAPTILLWTCSGAVDPHTGLHTDNLIREAVEV